MAFSFGATPAPAAAAPSTGGFGFGAPAAAATPAAAAAPASLFGAAPAPAPAAGAGETTRPSRCPARDRTRRTSSLSRCDGVSRSLPLAAPAPAGGGLFGAAAPAPAPTGAFGFGSTPAPAPASGGLFGATAPGERKMRTCLKGTHWISLLDCLVIGLPPLRTTCSPRHHGFVWRSRARSGVGIVWKTPCRSRYVWTSTAPLLRRHDRSQSLIASSSDFPRCQQHAAPATTGLFGAPAPAPASGLFGNTPATPGMWTWIRPLLRRHTRSH